MSHINFPDTNQEFLSELFSENGVPPPPSLPTAVEAALGLGCQHMRGPKASLNSFTWTPGFQLDSCDLSPKFSTNNSKFYFFLLCLFLSH